jgi:hypothetical protein
MNDTLKDPNYWRDRAERTRARASRFFNSPRDRDRILRIAEEYDRLAERAAEWQHSTPPAPGKERGDPNDSS